MALIYSDEKESPEQRRDRIGKEIVRSLIDNILFPLTQRTFEDGADKETKLIEQMENENVPEKYGNFFEKCKRLRETEQLNHEEVTLETKDSPLSAKSARKRFRLIGYACKHLIPNERMIVATLIASFLKQHSQFHKIKESTPYSLAEHLLADEYLKVRTSNFSEENIIRDVTELHENISKNRDVSHIAKQLEQSVPPSQLTQSNSHAEVLQACLEKSHHYNHIGLLKQDVQSLLKCYAQDPSLNQKKRGLSGLLTVMRTYQTFGREIFSYVFPTNHQGFSSWHQKIAAKNPPPVSLRTARAFYNK